MVLMRSWVLVLAVFLSTSYASAALLVGSSHVSSLNECAYSDQSTNYFGAWDPSTRTCQLSASTNERVVVTDSDVTLDCNQHTISISGSELDSVGILIDGRDEVAIQKCKIFNFHYAVMATNSSNISILSCGISQSGSVGVDFRNSQGLLVQSNLIENTSSSSVRFVNSNNAVVRDNQLISGTFGIHFGTSTTAVQIYNNIVRSHLFVAGGSVGATIQWNTQLTAGPNIIGGAFVGGNAYVNNGNNSYSTTCSDSDGNGICDSPFSFNAVSADNFPLAQPAVVNQPPVANAGGPYSAMVGEVVSFNGSTSSDPEGGTLTYLWNFGDGVTSDVANPTHVFEAAGVYSVTLTVWDSAGLSSSADTSATINALPINQPPVANAGGPYSGVAGAAISFSGSQSYDPEGGQLTYYWQFGDGGNSGLANPMHLYLLAGTYNASLTVTDAQGASSAVAVSVVVSNPAGSSTRERITQIIDEIDNEISNGNIPPNVGRRLKRPLDRILDAIDRYDSDNDGDIDEDDGCGIFGCWDAGLDISLDGLGDFLGEIEISLGNLRISLAIGLKLLGFVLDILQTMVGNPQAILDLARRAIVILGDVGILNPSQVASITGAIDIALDALGNGFVGAVFGQAGVIGNIVNGLTGSGVIPGSIGSGLLGAIERLKDLTAPLSLLGLLESAKSQVQSLLSAQVLNNLEAWLLARDFTAAIAAATNGNYVRVRFELNSASLRLALIARKSPQHAQALSGLIATIEAARAFL